MIQKNIQTLVFACELSIKMDEVVCVCMCVCVRVREVTLGEL